MTNLTELADRVETLDGPCYDTDELIGITVGFDFQFELGGAISRPPPHYTASLDAAMTLVPEGFDWLRKDFRTMTVVMPAADQKAWGRHIDATGATPALALCAAALRARDALAP